MACGLEVETNFHVAICEEYQDLREGKDSSEYSDLVSYFREVMKRREVLQK